MQAMCGNAQMPARHVTIRPFREEFSRKRNIAAANVLLSHTIARPRIFLTRRGGVARIGGESAPLVP